LGKFITNKPSYIHPTSPKSTAIIFSLDSNGVLLWCKYPYNSTPIGSPSGGDAGFDAQIKMANNKFIVSASTNCTLDFDNGITITGRQQNRQGILAVFDANTQQFTTIIDSVKDVFGDAHITHFATSDSQSVYAGIRYNSYLRIGPTQGFSNFGGNEDVCIAKWGFASATCTPLPLKMLSFNVIPRNEESAQLTWHTANEVNVKNFTIQRSLNGTTWENVGTVNAQNKVSNKYEFIDNLIPLTVDGKLYYRLQSTDFDGAMQYSETKQITLQHQTQNKVFVFPNPAKNIINISSKELLKEVKLFNTIGQQVIQQKLNNVNNFQLSIVNYQLPKGVYILNITASNGNVWNEKLVVE
jgi:hypothetical protein